MILGDFPSLIMPPPSTAWGRHPLRASGTGQIRLHITITELRDICELGTSLVRGGIGSMTQSEGPYASPRNGL